MTCLILTQLLANLIKQMKSIFSRFGIPEKVVSDNGPQYSSSEFTKFASDYGFKHTTSSPKYPQSNGLAERSVQTIKRIFQKCKGNKTDPHLGILEYRNTPLTVLITPLPNSYRVDNLGRLSPYSPLS